MEFLRKINLSSHEPSSYWNSRKEPVVSGRGLFALAAFSDPAKRRWKTRHSSNYSALHDLGSLNAI
ncbi:hypothetical protein N9918_00655 [Akkermansiaceae bacterium]|nr:hypothetical protein [Akkermansiaceae bacterium]